LAILCHSWFDHRLSGKFNHSMILKNTAVDYAWTPHTYCSNARQSNLMIGGSDGNTAMTVDGTGHVFLSKRFV